MLITTPSIQPRCLVSSFSLIGLVICASICSALEGELSRLTYELRYTAQVNTGVASSLAESYSRYHLSHWSHWYHFYP